MIGQMRNGHSSMPVSRRTDPLDTVLRCGLAMAIAWLGLASRCQAQTWGDPVWSDEFNATVAGTPPDATKWVYDFGAGKWGNRELETYCRPEMEAPCQADKPNVFQDGQGNLAIQALRTSPDPAPTGTWTSARLKTLGIQDFQYGRLEACMRLPTGAGLWPAFWLLGTVGPGFSGEMDIMENVPKSGQPGGLGPTVVETTIHGALGTGRRLFSLGADVTLPNGGRVDDSSCHVYGEIWSPFMIQMYVDDWRSPYFIRTANDVPTDGRWVFNDPNRFYFLLNVAVGGGWPGPPDATTPREDGHGRRRHHRSPRQWRNRARLPGLCRRDVEHAVHHRQRKSSQSFRGRFQRRREPDGESHPDGALRRQERRPGFERNPSGDYGPHGQRRSVHRHDSRDDRITGGRSRRRGCFCEVRKAQAAANRARRRKESGAERCQPILRAGRPWSPERAKESGKGSRWNWRAWDAMSGGTTIRTGPGPMRIVVHPDIASQARCRGELLFGPGRDRCDRRRHRRDWTPRFPRPRR